MGHNPDEFRLRMLELLKSHPEILSQQSTLAYEALPIDEKELESRSREFASYALRKAARLGIVRPNNKARYKRLNIDKLDYRTVILKGQDHHCSATECQDEVLVWRSSNNLVAVICDGAGAFELSHFGSRLVARDTMEIVQNLLQEKNSGLVQNDSFMNERFLGELYRRLYISIHELVKETRLHPGLAYKSFLATTIQILIVSPVETAVLAIGDGFINWRGSIQSISDVTGRAPRLRKANHPPLMICGLAFDAGSPPIRKSDHEIKLALHAEAMNFDIVAYDNSCDALMRPVEMSTDGLRFCEQVSPPESGVTFFPLHRLLRDLSAQRVSEIGTLFNFAAEASEGESKIGMLFDLLAPSGTGEAKFPEFDSFVQSFLRVQFEESISTHSDLQQAFESVDLSRLVRMLGNGHAEHALDGKQAIMFLEKGASDFAQRLLAKDFGIATNPYYEPVWDDLGFVQVFLLG